MLHEKSSGGRCGWHEVEGELLGRGGGGVDGSKPMICALINRVAGG